MTKKQEKKKLLYVRASSIEDIARLVCDFESTPKNAFLSKIGGKEALLAFGENIGSATIAYYVELKEKAKEMLRYSAEEGKAEFVDGAENAPNTCNINVIGIDLSDMAQWKEDPGEVSLARIASVKDLIKIVITKSVTNESIEGMYSFPYNGKTIFCAFDTVEQLADDKKILYYTIAEENAQRSFARYDYSKNAVDFSESIGEHTFLYVKIINLSQPFPFFKPE